MLKLLNDAIEAHGGIKKWREFCKIDAQIVSGGKLFEMKGVPQDASSREMTVWLHEQKASVYPFGNKNQRSSFSASRIAIETIDGNVVAERTGHPIEIHGHLASPKWDALDRGYFNGYALWMYLTTPFSLLLPGIKVTEAKPWREGDEIWKGLTVAFPPDMAVHSAVQTFYFGDDNLIRRNDYQLDFAGGIAVAQYISELKNVQGILMPSKRRAYKRGPDGKPVMDELMVKIDLSNFHFSKWSEII